MVSRCLGNWAKEFNATPDGFLHRLQPVGLMLLSVDRKREPASTDQ